MKARLRFSARGIVVTYALVAGLWIAFSDRVATALAPSVEALASISTVKGLAFVLVTSGLLGIMLFGYEAEQARRTRELEALVAERERAEAHLGRLNRVLRTMSLANEALVRTEEEPDLLRAFCATIIGRGAFLGAWVGYKQLAPDSTIRPVSWAGPLEDFLNAFEVSWLDEDRGSAGPAGTSIREGRTVISMDVAGDETLVFRAPMIERGWRSLAALPLRVDDEVIGTLVIYAGEPDSFGSDEIALLEGLAENLSYGIGTLRSRTAAAHGEADRRRLAVAIEQSADAVMITDTKGAIEYVNPAFESSTGYTADEVLGQNPRILQSGLQTPAFYAAMWEALSAGQTWTSDLVNRRKDGTVFTEAASISPVRDPAGDTLGYVAVKRDVTRQRAAESRAVTQARERSLIAAALATVRPGSSLEQTTAALCTQIARLPDVALATLLAFDLDGRAAPLGAIASDGTSLERRRLSEARSRHLRARAREGPWIESLGSSSGSAASREFRARAVQALAYVPLIVDGVEVGLLEVGSSEEGSTERLAGQLSALIEFGGIAGALLGPALVARAQVADARARIRGILDNHSYDPVFQPIVDLETRVAVGYEALTRFADGTPPDQQFASATAQGMAAELEAATLRAALTAARGLPADVWLSVNVSPPLVLAGEPLRSILLDAPRPLVLEVTEEQAIADYPSFRAAIATFRTDLRLAVDDAGAGFASLRHISELRPALVKLDRALVADIDGDPVRQALVAGMHHFAETVDCSLIAEGIETDAELATLRALGVRFGQGYLLGRPAPLTSNGDPAASRG